MVKILFYIGIWLIYHNAAMVTSNSEFKKTKILIADDHPLVAIALERIFSSQSDFEIIGTASDGESAIQLADSLSPDLIIMDIAMPTLTGLEATKRIKAMYPEILILIFTVYSDLEHICGIFDADADGYLLKTAKSDEILRTVRGLVAGDTVFSRQFFKEILGKRLSPLLKKNENKSLNAIQLGPQEYEILLLISKGFSNKEIADKMQLSMSTVKNYITGIFNKLNVNSRAEAVSRAIKLGIIDLDNMQ
jgi:DNA-binding NarL/FixJ family response regulator